MSENFLTYRNKRWMWFGIISAILLIISYLVYSRQTVPHGGTAMGLAYGVLGTGIILVLMALGIRKRRYSSALGTVQGWTSAHVYLGLLTLLIISMHAGFRFRPDVHTLAFVLLTIVVLSGILGVLLYLTIPPRLTKYEAGIQADKIDREITHIMEEIRTLSKDKSDAFADVYRREISRAHSRGHQGWRILFREPGDLMLSNRAQELAAAAPGIPSGEFAAFQSVSRLVMQRAQLETTLVAQMRLKNAMEAWLYVHVPVSIAMMIAIAVHVVVVFYY